MYCPSCGEEIEEGSAFCGQCGENLAGESETQTETGGRSEPEPEPQPEPDAEPEPEPAQTGQPQANPGARSAQAGAAGGGIGAWLGPGMRLNVFGGLAGLVGVLQFVTYIDTLADMLAWQGHIMFWGLFAAGGMLLALGFFGGEDPREGGIDETGRFLAVLAALLIFALIGSAAGVAFDMPSFSGSF